MNVVQNGGADLNMAVTSREEILAVCREIVAEEGLSSVNMRLVASRCNIALGSVYNYFPSKSELLLATIESVWMDIFHMNGQVLVFVKLYSMYCLVVCIRCIKTVRSIRSFLICIP